MELSMEHHTLENSFTYKDRNRAYTVRIEFATACKPSQQLLYVIHPFLSAEIKSGPGPDV